MKHFGNSPKLLFTRIGNLANPTGILKAYGWWKFKLFLFFFLFFFSCLFGSFYKLSNGLLFGSLTCIKPLHHEHLSNMIILEFPTISGGMCCYSFVRSPKQNLTSEEALWIQPWWMIALVWWSVAHELDLFSFATISHHPLLWFWQRFAPNIFECLCLCLCLCMCMCVCV